jgi:hypothetical protein
MFLEFGRTTVKTYGFHIVRIQLVPNIKDIQGPLIAITSQQPYFDFRMHSGDFSGYLL